MKTQKMPGFLILDRKGEYITDTLDQRGNTVFGLHHHPKAAECMVIVSPRDFSGQKAAGTIFDHLAPQFCIRDIDPVDLADFLPGLTETQANLIQDYAHVPTFYNVLLAETRLGRPDQRDWFKTFPGLFEFNDKGKKRLLEIERKAEEEERNDFTDDERIEVQSLVGGRKHEVLMRAAGAIKRFCANPFFGGSARGIDLLVAPSCVATILDYLAQGKLIFIDMRGRPDDEYTMVAALFARRLLTENKRREDAEHIRACIVMEEAHNILSDDELKKGMGSGSVFIELAREGRSFKLGFVLVTQQPDARSIAPQVVKTIDTVVAFNMPPDDARHLQRLKPTFADLELEISNAPEFHGVAVSDSRPILFRSGPVDDSYMRRTSAGELKAHLHEQAPPEEPAPAAASPTRPHILSLDERLAALARRRQADIQPVALATLHAWQRDGVDGEDTELDE
jgi:hypothetical protein